MYSYDPVKRIHHLKRAHSKSVLSLAIHPTEPYLLSASKDGYNKLWDYANGWKLTRVFGSFVFPWQHLSDVRQHHVVFNPKDPNFFASIQGQRIKVRS